MGGPSRPLSSGGFEPTSGPPDADGVVGKEGNPAGHVGLRARARAFGRVEKGWGGFGAWSLCGRRMRRRDPTGTPSSSSLRVLWIIPLRSWRYKPWKMIHITLEVQWWVMIAKRLQ